MGNYTTSIKLAAGLLCCCIGIHADTIVLNGMDDIYGAGQITDPGGGALPTAVSFAAGANRTLTFSSVTGAWYETNYTPLSPEGSQQACSPFSGETVNATGGLSSYTATDFCNALVGVFLTGDTPPVTAPAGLTFYQSNGSGGGIQTNFTSLAPLIGQVFYIGDGLTGNGTGAEQTFLIPTGATELYLGEADACGFSGPPGCFFDNGGTVVATYSISGIESGTPEPATGFEVVGGFGLLLVGLRGRVRQH